MHYFYIIRYDTHGLPVWGQLADIGDVPDPFAIAYNAASPRWARLSMLAATRNGAAGAQKLREGPAIAPRSPQPNERRASASEPGRREPTEE